MSILPITDEDSWEFYGEPGLLPANDGDVVPLFDYSGNGRSLAITGTTAPILKTNVVNGKSVIRFNSSTDPLANTANINIRCGFVVSKYSASTFPSYAGLLSGLNNIDVLTGNSGDTKFFNFNHLKYDFRSNDRIYPANQAIAPMNVFQITFFKFWQGSIPLDGIQLGRQRTLNRKWIGDIGLLALTNRNLDEDIIADYTKKIATHFNLTMADVYPYQADIGGHNEEPEIAVNFYDPPEGNRISEVISPLKQSLDLKFSSADQVEIDFFKPFFTSHYQTGLPFIYRDYRFTPPRDVEGYFDAPYEISGEGNNFAYGFKVREK